MNTIINSLLQYLNSGKELFHKESEKDKALLTDFCKIIKYKFKNFALLKLALTHDSYFRKNEGNVKKVSPFERMEFLGDAILGLIVSEELFIEYPEKKEGFLSKLKAKIVCEKYLANIARDINLGDYLFLSNEELFSNGNDKDSIVSDALESLICAIYLDSNLEITREFIVNFVMKNYKVRIKRYDIVNYKSILQEFTQEEFKIVPDYECIKETGPSHNKLFIFNVIVNGEIIGSGEGRNKKDAHQDAAKSGCLYYKLV